MLYRFAAPGNPVGSINEKTCRLGNLSTIEVLPSDIFYDCLWLTPTISTFLTKPTSAGADPLGCSAQVAVLDILVYML